MKNLSTLSLEEVIKLDPFCLKDSPLQKRLKISSILYLSLGAVTSTFIIFTNVIIVVFFYVSKKSKKSPLCIYSVFLAVFNIVRLLEFALNLLIKLQLLDTVRLKEILYGATNKSNDRVCKWINFFSNFAGHVCVYLVLLLQFQRYLALKKPTFKLNIMLHNYALTYFICISILFVFLVFDEFYLFESYYTSIIYCPLTMVFICVLNENFRLLGSIKFDPYMYHYLCTIVYNLVPLILSAWINVCIFVRLHRPKFQTIDNGSSDAARKISFSLNSNSSIRRTSVSVALSNKEQHSSSVQLPSPTQPSSSSLCVKPRTRLSSSTTSSPGVTTNANAPWTFSIKRSKRESQIRRVNEIYVQNADVGYNVIIVSMLQMINALPTTMLKYLADVNNKAIDHMKPHENVSNEAREHMLDYMPSTVMGNKPSYSYVDIYYMFIIYGVLDMLNFNIFLYFQFYSCRLLYIEFRKFLEKNFFFKRFVKPKMSHRRNSSRSSNVVTSNSIRRASRV